MQVIAETALNLGAGAKCYISTIVCGLYRLFSAYGIQQIHCLAIPDPKTLTVRMSLFLPELL